MWRVVLSSFAALGAACGTDDPPSCYIDRVVERYIDAQQVMDCSSGALYEASRACALEAAAAYRPFHARWEFRAPVEEIDLGAYVGVDINGRYEISWFEMDVRPQGADGDCEGAVGRGSCNP